MSRRSYGRFGGSDFFGSILGYAVKNMVRFGQFMMFSRGLPASLGKLFVSIQSLYKAYLGVFMSSALINYDWYYI